MNRPTKAQVEARVLEIVRIRLDGAEFWDIREYVREKEQEDGSPWKLGDGARPLSDSQLWRYIAKADVQISATCRASRKRLLRRHLAQRRNLYAKAVSQGDVRAALACIDSEAKMLGLYELDFAEQLEQLRQQLEEIKRDGTGDPQAAGGAPGRGRAGGPDGALAAGAPGADPAAN
jgi:hypothetical protein